MRLDPAFLPGAIDDRALDGLDRHRVVVDVQRAGRFARRGAYAAGELREVVGGMQRADRRFPLVAIDEVVPVWYQIVDRTAVVAERNAAIHATRRLLRQFRFRQRLEEFGPRPAPRLGLFVAAIVPLDFEEPGWLAHPNYPQSAAAAFAAWRSARSSSRARRKS